MQRSWFCAVVNTHTHTHTSFWPATLSC